MRASAPVVAQARSSFTWVRARLDDPSATGQQLQSTTSATTVRLACETTRTDNQQGRRKLVRPPRGWRPPRRAPLPACHLWRQA